jgi:N utilization substance protein B
VLGAHELANHLDIPYRVVINEAVELTKTFGGTEAHRFVNGVLDRVAAVVRQSEISAQQAAD